LFLGILWLVIDPTKEIWYYYFLWLDFLFWYYSKFIFCPVSILFAISLFKDRDMKFDTYRLLWLLFIFSSSITVIWYFVPNYNSVFNLYFLLEPLIWCVAVLFFSFALFVFSLVILFNFSPIAFTRWTFAIASDLKNNLKKDSTKLSSELKETKKFVVEKRVESKKKDYDNMLLELKKEKEELLKNKQDKNLKNKQEQQLTINEAPKQIIIEKKSSLGSIFSKEKSVEQTKVLSNPDFANWKLPNLALLSNRWTDFVVDETDIKKKQIEIKEKLLQFRIEVDMEWYKIWPTVTQYRLKPKEWVKLQKIEALKKDLTLALHANNIRIQAPIPWIWLVWIEVPNEKRQAVWLKEVLKSRAFNDKKIELPMAIWKDVSGNMIVWDLAEMPHLLVAGQTKSGKSVWMNWFLLSFLYKFSPSELKFIMIDPKRVELSIYNGIPHLLTPVISNPDKALNSLKWCVAEMLRRYDLATSKKAKNLLEYNEKVTKEERWPYIVVVIDELADFMMSWNKKEVEAAIARIAQMWRAAWMHLIVATQRPSVDVITGLIKANVPSRIAFTVASQIDSRTVIDKVWAEDLLGRWDMLYNPTWAIAPERVQWVFVDTAEIESVVNEIKLTIDPNMLENMQDDSIVNWISKNAWSVLEWYEWNQDEDPEIISQAIEVLRESKKGSTSLIQRKLWLWYARAAKILDILEEIWIVWPSNGSKPREVYLD